MLVRIRFEKGKPFRMTRNFQIAGQLVATFGQVMMDPMEKYFGWSAGLAQMLHAAISFAQLAMGILAHNYNKDGSVSQ
jgi:hypothetical protein